VQKYTHNLCDIFHIQAKKYYEIYRHSDINVVRCQKEFFDWALTFDNKDSLSSGHHKPENQNLDALNCLMLVDKQL
jgi:hypothetical protein